MNKRLTLAAILLAVLLLAASASLGEAPVPLDWADPGNWACWAQGEDKPADLFIICPTVDLGEDGSLLMDTANPALRASFTGALNMELGIYNEVCAVYAPFYRQVTFPVYSMGAEGDQYFACAYEDVRQAFLYYLRQCNPGRPLVLAGFSQGADMAIRLVKEFFGEDALSDRLVAVYAIGWRVTEEETAACPHLRMAQGEDDLGVIVAFNSEAEYVTGSLLVPEGVRTLSINPLNWRTDGTPAQASENLGACFTDYSGSIVQEIPGFCGAYLDEERGTLKVPDINDAVYPGFLFPDGVYHLYDYQFFYRNLQRNVAVRVNAWLGNE